MEFDKDMIKVRTAIFYGDYAKDEQLLFGEGQRSLPALVPASCVKLCRVKQHRGTRYSTGLPRNQG